MGAQSQIVVYSAEMCGDCQELKTWMEYAGIAFENRDIRKNPEYGKELASKTGKEGVPYVIINGEWKKGYDPAAPSPKASPANSSACSSNSDKPFSCGLPGIGYRPRKRCCMRSPSRAPLPNNKNTRTALVRGLMRVLSHPTRGPVCQAAQALPNIWLRTN